MRKSTIFVVCAAALGLSACAVEAPTIDLLSYAPIVDITYGEREKYEEDLNACRLLGMQAQRNYARQFKEADARERQAAFIGALTGAALGAAIDDDDNDDDGAFIGALIGESIASEVAGNESAYAAELARFGPSVIVDKCLIGRGYKVISVPGSGGGSAR